MILGTQNGSIIKAVAIPNKIAPFLLTAFTWSIVEIPPVAMTGTPLFDKILTISNILGKSSGPERPPPGIEKNSLFKSASIIVLYWVFPAFINVFGWLLTTSAIVNSKFDFESGETTRLIETASNARYVESGHIIFVRDAALWAVPFDVQS